MSENSPVKENECDARRKDLYNKIQDIKEGQDQMKGGLKVVCYGVPIVLGIFGWFGKMELTRIHEAIKNKKTVSFGAASIDVEWDEVEGRMVPLRSDTEEELELTEEKLPPGK